MEINSITLAHMLKFSCNQTEFSSLDSADDSLKLCFITENTTLKFLNIQIRNILKHLSSTAYVLSNWVVKSLKYLNLDCFMRFGWGF